MPGETVYVLGAGFTKGLCPSAPLMVDDYGLAVLCNEYGVRTPEREFIDHACYRTRGSSPGNARVDIEWVLTRLETGAPYDRALGQDRKFRSLRPKVFDLLISRIDSATQTTEHRDLLVKFARHVLDTGAHVVTLNYDTLMDRALWYAGDGMGPAQGWYPDHGYGFPCRSSSYLADPGHQSRVDLAGRSMPSVLLKLHGSLNWRVALGSVEPFTVGDVFYHHRWAAIPQWHENVDEGATPFLDREPLIVPPVLTKPDIGAYAILAVTWARAFEALRAASRVVFVGYSLPQSDFATAALFEEAVPLMAKISLVTLGAGGQSDESTDALLERYCNVITHGRARKPELRTDGAVAWMQELVGEE